MIDDNINIAIVVVIDRYHEPFDFSLLLEAKNGKYDGDLTLLASSIKCRDDSTSKYD